MVVIAERISQRRRILTGTEGEHGRPKIIALFGVKETVKTKLRSAGLALDSIRAARTVVSAFGQKKEH